MNFITIPAACALVVLAHPMVQALFERGTFQASATDLTASLLPYAACGLIALAANVVLTRCCFACKETMLAGRDLGRHGGRERSLSMRLASQLGARGLLLANSVSQSMQAILLLIVVARLVSGIDWGALLISTGKVIVSSLAMLAALEWILRLGVTPEATLASRGWFLFGQIAIGATVFIAVARMIGVEELDLAWRTIVAKFERNLVSPPENREAPIA